MLAYILPPSQPHPVVLKAAASRYRVIHIATFRVRCGNARGSSASQPGVAATFHEKII